MAHIFIQLHILRVFGNVPAPANREDQKLNKLVKPYRISDDECANYDRSPLGQVEYKAFY